MKRRHVVGIVFILLIFAVISIKAFNGGEKFEAGFENQEGERVDVMLEVANNSAERRKGLMNRPYLPKKHGMIFIYRREGQKSFWMKNTYIPLDMIFVSENLTIKNIEHAKPQPFTAESELKSYKSEGEVKYVIEMNRGFSDRHNIQKGDKFVPGSKLDSCCMIE